MTVYYRNRQAWTWLAARYPRSGWCPRGFCLDLSAMPTHTPCPFPADFLSPQWAEAHMLCVPGAGAGSRQEQASSVPGQPHLRACKVPAPCKHISNSKLQLISHQELFINEAFVSFQTINQGFHLLKIHPKGEASERENIAIVSLRSGCDSNKRHIFKVFQ